MTLPSAYVSVFSEVPWPSVAVVIPVFNEMSNADALAASLGALEYPGELVIVAVDDGSADATVSTLRSHGIRVVEQKHAGPGAARNLGVASTESEVVVFTDADCQPSPRFVRSLVHTLEAARADVAMGRYETQSPSRISRLAQLEFEERYDRLRVAPDLDFGATYALAIRRMWFAKADGFDGSVYESADHEDLDLAWRLHDLGASFAFSEQAVVYHRHAESWGDYLRTKAHRGYWRMRTLKRHPDRLVSDSYTPGSLRFHVASAAALPFLILAAWLSVPGRWVTAAWTAAFLATLLPLARLAWREDREVLPFVPLFAVGRGAALAWGAVRGSSAVLVDTIRDRSGKSE